MTGQSSASVEEQIKQELRNPGSLVNRAWAAAGNPKTPDEINAFYKQNDAYLYNLLGAHCGHTAWERCLWRRTAFSLLAKNNCKNVLDYGAGMGFDSLYFAQAGMETTYFEINANLREYVRLKALKESISLRLVDDLAPLQPGSFDAVYCTEVLEHVPAPDKVLGQIARLLKPGGCLLATESFGLVGEHFATHLPENARLEN